MHNIKVILEYEGTNYSGFQKQGKKNPSPFPTIQEVIEASLYKLTGENIKIISASRTDAGERERDRFIEEGDRLREKILKQAKTNIDYELKSAKEAIKAEAVEIAMELAEKKLKEKLTKEEQERLLEESLTKIGGSR